MRVPGFAGMIAMLLVCMSLVAQAGTRDEELTVVKSQKSVSFADIRNTPGLTALTFLGYEREYLAVAKRMLMAAGGRLRGLEPPWREHSDPDTPVGDVLDFYRRDGDRFFRIAVSNPGFIFMGMLSEHGVGADRLITTWETGSAKAMIIFARRSHQIVKAFSWAGKVTPELIGLANDGESYLVVTDGRIFEADGKTTYPETASIYAWEGSRYVLKKKVPWEQRFEALRERWPREYPKQ